ncbi:MAG TPA: hypothetical protein VFK38_09435 [Candidatus Limnocylindrales bacterium]|nr:hypothetical protein [Candidatus Limnocylindrales bacterium]
MTDEQTIAESAAMLTDRLHELELRRTQFEPGSGERAELEAFTQRLGHAIDEYERSGTLSPSAAELLGPPLT